MVRCAAAGLSGSVKGENFLTIHGPSRLSSARSEEIGQAVEILQPYEDHCGMWENELRAWMPGRIFDCHVHVTPREAIGPISMERRDQALTAFRGFDLDSLTSWYGDLCRGKSVVGVAAFPLSFREVDVDAANQYMISLMKKAHCVRGFVLADPKDAQRSIRVLGRALDEGVRFSGIKPYFDLLGKDVYGSTMPEYVPEKLLEYGNEQGLVLMLHTSGTGVGEAGNQAYIRTVAQRYPKLKIILAHMGRFLDPSEFIGFLRTDVMDHPNVFLEASSVSHETVFRAVFKRRELWSRLLFGSDLPYGLIDGYEYWSEETGPTFVTRRHYPWSRPDLAFPGRPVTYNAYHTIKAIKDAIGGLGLGEDVVAELKEDVFLNNALRQVFLPT